MFKRCENARKQSESYSQKGNYDYCRDFFQPYLYPCSHAVSTYYSDKNTSAYSKVKTVVLCDCIAPVRKSDCYQKTFVKLWSVYDTQKDKHNRNECRIQYNLYFREKFEACKDKINAYHFIERNSNPRNKRPYYTFLITTFSYPFLNLLKKGFFRFRGYFFFRFQTRIFCETGFFVFLSPRIAYFFIISARIIFR